MQSDLVEIRGMPRSTNECASMLFIQRINRRDFPASAIDIAMQFRVDGLLEFRLLILRRELSRLHLASEFKMAAAELNVTAGAVSSRQVKAGRGKVGVALFDRHTKGVSLAV